MTKKCTGTCGLVKRVSQDSLRSEFYSKTRWPDGSVRTWQSRCKVCMRADTRDRMGVKRRDAPYNPRKAPLTREQTNARRRARYANAMKLKRKAQKIRENNRMDAALRRRRLGIPVRRTSSGEQVVYKLNDPRR